MESEKIIEPPLDLQCPLSMQLFVDPVLAADGITYEREYILAWMNKSSISPTTRQPFTYKMLFKNMVVQKEAEEWLKNCPQTFRQAEATRYDIDQELKPIMIDCKKKEIQQEHLHQVIVQFS